MIAFCGCGGGGDGEASDLRAAVKPAVVKAVQRAQLRRPLTPSYLEDKAASPTLLSIKVSGKGDIRRTTSIVETRYSVAPRSDKAAFLRLAPEGVAVSVQRKVYATARRMDGKWKVAAKAVRVKPTFPAPSPDQQARARSRAVAAVTSLLTWPGNVKAYDKAQEPYYVTKPAGATDFDQPGFDPTPSLILERGLTAKGGPDIPVGAAWKRADDGGRDDLALKDALVDSNFDCQRFVLQAMQPETVTGNPIVGTSPDAAASDGLTQRVTISGRAVLIAGAWQNGTPGTTCDHRKVKKSPVTVARGKLTIAYTARLVRLRSDDPDAGGWAIDQLRLAKPTGAAIKSTYSDRLVYAAGLPGL